MVSMFFDEQDASEFGCTGLAVYGPDVSNTVIARSKATKQSIFLEALWIASLRSQ
jgi:hypothetical protein